MMKSNYRQIYQDVNHQRCVFEKVILLRYARCEHKKKLLLAEREAASCGLKNAQVNCQLLLNTMRDNARFALQITQANEPLPHSKELKVQAGGLFGLQQLLESKSTPDFDELFESKKRYDENYGPPITNIHQTMSGAIKKYGQVKNFPFKEIIKTVLRFNLPSRRKKR
ncbi:MAG: hypothetical protein GY781_05055 [Gammaproteobacteria bacterium]|nr:hypothetical protein [Gammaproteobacteria bacterium]